MENKQKKFSLIYTIVNQGYQDVVMQAAKENGARGGTSYLASGTGNKEYQSFYGIEITPEKEVIMIIVEESKKDAIMKAIYEVAGLETNGAGISYSLSLDDVYGVSSGD